MFGVPIAAGYWLIAALLWVVVGSQLCQNESDVELVGWTIFSLVIALAWPILLVVALIVGALWVLGKVFIFLGEADSGRMPKLRRDD